MGREKLLEVADDFKTFLHDDNHPIEANNRNIVSVVYFISIMATLKTKLNALQLYTLHDLH